MDKVLIDKILQGKAKKIENSGNKITVYVPNKIAGVAVEICSNFFTNAFGNYYAQLDNGKNEHIALCCYCNDEQLEKHIYPLITTIQSFNATGIQIEINEEKYVI